jgi:hypothetical protein
MLGVDIMGFILFFGCLLLRGRRLARVCLGIAATYLLARSLIRLFGIIHVMIGLLHMGATAYPDSLWAGYWQGLLEAGLFVVVAVLGSSAMIWIALRKFGSVLFHSNHTFSPA